MFFMTCMGNMRSPKVKTPEICAKYPISINNEESRHCGREGGREGAEEGRKQSVYVIKIGERGRNAELRGTAVAVSFVLVIRI